jgi:hypothetical protein
MGHADRPRFDDALSLDAQSRSVCLSLVEQRRQSYSNANSVAISYSYCDGYRNRNC